MSYSCYFGQNSLHYLSHALQRYFVSLAPSFEHIPLALGCHKSSVVGLGTS